MSINKVQTRQQSRFGVGDKLLIGYFVTFMAIVLCMGVGVFSFKKIQSYQQDLTDRTIPSMLDLYNITKHVAVIVDLSDSMEIIQEEKELEKTHRNLGLLLNEVNNKLSIMERREGETSITKDVIEDIDALKLNINRNVNSLGELIKLNEILSQKYSDISQIIEAMLIQISYLKVDASVIFDSYVSEKIVSSSLGVAIIKDAYYVNLLADIQTRLNKVANSIYLAKESVESEKVNIVRKEYHHDMRIITRALVKIRDDNIRVQLGKKIRGLISVGQSAENVFDMRLKVIELHNSIKRNNISNKILLLDLRAYVQSLQKTLELSLESNLTELNDTTRHSTWTMLGITLFALICASLFIWLYIFNGVLKRIKSLSNVTAKMANNIWDTHIEPMQEKELRDLENALHLLKDRTIDMYAKDELLEKRAIELERSNADLEQFAYVASHDLKAPLRAIDNLAHWIEEDLHEIMTGDVKENISLMKQRIQRMECLLEDLLNYSVVDTQYGAVTEINTSALVKEVFDFVSGDSNFSLIMHGEWMDIHTPVPLLELIFRNLFSNTIRHHDKGVGNIIVDCKTVNSKLHISVMDDGPGIEEEYHQKIFEMFQKLHARNNQDSTGMGLALIKKIIGIAGCEIRVISNPKQGRGTTFAFTWPIVWEGKSIAA